MIPDRNSTWSMPMYMCSTAAKATIKTVAFRLNETSGLKGLVIDRVTDKSYQSKSDMPLWGVEKLNNFTIAAAPPLFGIVSADVGNRDDISTIQREHLWIPGSPAIGTSNPLGVLQGGISLPGNIIAQTSMDSTYSMQLSSSTSDTALYSGQGDFALYEKWSTLSANATGVELIINLIWTDLVANSVVGTRSWLSDTQPNAFRDRENAEVAVVTWSRNIRYRALYAIPAAVTLLLTLFIGSVAFLLVLFRRTGLGKMRLYLAQTSAGRILGTFCYPGLGDPLAPRRIWIQQVGVQTVNLIWSKHSTTHLGSGPVYSNVPLTDETVDANRRLSRT